MGKEGEAAEKGGRGRAAFVELGGKIVQHWATSDGDGDDGQEAKERDEHLGRKRRWTKFVKENGNHMRTSRNRLEETHNPLIHVAEGAWVDTRSRCEAKS